MSLANIESEYKLIRSWNLTYSQDSQIYYPKNEIELKKIFQYLKKNKKNFVIKTGDCSYEGKSINKTKTGITISLKNFNKLININHKKKIVKVQSGVKLSNLLLILKEKKYSMYSVPGGEHVTVGGAIGANVIGKDSTEKIGAFGDSIINLNVMFYDGNVEKLNNRSKKFFQFIGSFGFFGIVLNAEIKIKKVFSKNLISKSCKVNNFNEIKKLLHSKNEFKYIQLNPFFNTNRLGVFFYSNFYKENKDFYKIKSFKANFLEILFFKISSLFINTISWKIFYNYFVNISKNKSKIEDLHNFFFSSKYKHLVPYLCKNNLIDYEILVKKDLEKILLKLKKLILKNKLYPIYIIIKKLHKSKKSYFYNFNDNGYSIAIAFDNYNLNSKAANSINHLIKKENLNINLAKTDNLITKKIKNKFIKKIKFQPKNYFMSVFKYKILNNFK